MINTLLVGAKPFSDGFRVIVPENWELSVGDSRTLDCIFEDKTENRVLSWSVSPEDTATVDKFGRVTALKEGTATVTAKTADGLTDSVTLNVVKEPTIGNTEKLKSDYMNGAVKETENKQKIVTRFSVNAPEVPEIVKTTTDYTNSQSVVTPDGAKWEITSYGVLRTDENAATKRDKKQRFMGDRYFYSADTTAPNVLAIFSDGVNGIWTLMKAGVTHIEYKDMSGTKKAAVMSKSTQDNISRRGMVDCAYRSGNKWKSYESDNDGLWTSMYGGGELMRYAVLKNTPGVDKTDLEEAKKAAYTSAEAVLLLYYISMRTGTVDSYIRLFENGGVTGDNNSHRLSGKALLKGGNYSVYVPGQSPAAQFTKAQSKLAITGSDDLITNGKLLTPFSPDSWSDPSAPENKGAEYEKRTQLLKGFVARTYSLKSEGNGYWGDIYWSVNDNKTSTGVSSIPEDNEDYILNGENLRGVTVDASGKVPQRLWNDLIGSGYSPEDIVYKGDTSADEFAGHMFIFKLIYDILGEEDAEIKSLVVNAVDNLAQHLSDNGYRLLDGSGQPTTWGKFDRTTFLNSSGLSVAPLHAEMLLTVFKTAAYITGYQKWEDEYRLAALDPAYEYAKVMTQYYERYIATASSTVKDTLGEAGGIIFSTIDGTKLCETLFRLLLNYSAEEMAMLGFYVLFQTETDDVLLDYYRSALNSWWISMKYSENPLWYYIYQLAYPEKEMYDAYGNSLIKTAAWSLSRTPVDTVQYRASNENRDDIATLKLSALGIDDDSSLSYSLKDGKMPDIDTEDTASIVKYVLKALTLDWAVAAPDERSIHKYNNNSYDLAEHYSPNCMEPSTIYTLPYWMGRYHNMIKE